MYTYAYTYTYTCTHTGTHMHAHAHARVHIHIDILLCALISDIYCYVLNNRITFITDIFINAVAKNPIVGYLTINDLNLTVG